MLTAVTANMHFSFIAQGNSVEERRAGKNEPKEEKERGLDGH